MTGRGVIIALTVSVSLPGRTLLGENLNDAWNRALEVNQGLRAEQLTSLAQGLSVQAAHADRLPRVQNFTLNTVLTPTPRITFGRGSGGQGAQPSNPNPNGGASGAVPASGFYMLGRNQYDIPLTNTSLVQPIYTGGRLRRTEDAARAQLGAQRSQEERVALDLKQTVAEAYVGVLRARRAADVSESNVRRLESFLRDVRNRLQQGLATRNDELSAEVSLSEARQGLIEARKDLASAWARYNRYLCRPATVEVPLEEVVLPRSGTPAALADEAVRLRPEFAGMAASEIASLEAEAVRLRPELAALTEEAHGYRFQAQAQMADLKPQVNF